MPIKYHFCISLSYDAVAKEWSTQQDVMHLAPVFCGAAGWGHVEQLRPFLAQPPLHSSGWAPLSWPPVVMTLIGAASAAHMPLDAAELAYRYIDASYRSTDTRELDEHGGLPGVTREYHRTISVGKWGEIDLSGLSPPQAPAVSTYGVRRVSASALDCNSQNVL